MREKDEREGEKEGTEGGWQSVEGRKPQRRKGFVHRLETGITSFFFTNFPEAVTVTVLWSEFANFGCVGEVYIPKKTDKQGRRFGFVKYRDVIDAVGLLARLGDIWFGSYKLRVNISRFGKGDKGRVKEASAPTTSNALVVRDQHERSFKDALVVRDQHERSFKDAVVSGEDKVDHQHGAGVVQGVREVVWEVEPEAEMMSKLQGSYVGFLAESHDTHTIQNNFILDGYHNLKVISLGYRKVLLVSTVAGEVA
ncbi:hypothetical protein P8452_16897 [Trifolium repens]|nr:hypothetical protein P8452_16897 [Trifolium repens]